MSKRLALAVFGLVGLCASRGLAGTTGNGSRPVVVQYTFCYGGNVKVVYLSQVMATPPNVSAPDLGNTYGECVKATYGLPGVDRVRCVTANTSADAAAARQQYKGMLGPGKIVEINWAG
jgi:hypothetical protein